MRLILNPVFFIISIGYIAVALYYINPTISIIGVCIYGFIINSILIYKKYKK